MTSTSSGETSGLTTASPSRETDRYRIACPLRLIARMWESMRIAMKDLLEYSQLEEQEGDGIIILR
jgi:hypothetical protein